VALDSKANSVLADWNAARRRFPISFELRTAIFAAVRELDFLIQNSDELAGAERRLHWKCGVS
jgi:hypothetical protein